MLSSLIFISFMQDSISKRAFEFQSMIEKVGDGEGRESRG
jgi:hypothetical protein